MEELYPNLTPEELFRVLAAGRRPWHDNYLAMFSSLWGGFSLYPELWGVPPDDHMVHRGDAVFEFFKVVQGQAYCLPEHLERLSRSAEGMGIDPPPLLGKLMDILKKAHKLGGHQDYSVRLTISRGPGSFSVNPYECQGTQLYLVTMRLKKPSSDTYVKGIRLMTTPFPAKTIFSGLKTCDYLHNLLAKKAAMDAGGDYAVSFDPDGFLAEGATENVLVVTKDRELIAPPLERILKGVTMMRVMDLAKSLVADGTLKAVVHRDILKNDLRALASEILLTSTSFDVLGVSHWDGDPVGEGRTGPVTKALSKLIDEEIHSGGEHSVSLA
ncbi:MAG: aminotransferase class IV [Deltaproteobacteria bacterium]|jgi:branched-chain amino acid aminotransferase|nr:aminotransferase class IV [Deltaproteobacteria bacterium]